MPFADDFPILHKDLIYFDSAATSQKPKCVIDAMMRFYSHEYATVNRAVYTLAEKATDQVHKIREKIKIFINAAHTSEIIFTKGTLYL